jgi:hypothetical protein
MAKNAIQTPYDDAGFPAQAALTAALTGTAVVKPSAGRLLKVIVTTVLGAGAVTIYDNASAASGTVLMVIPSTTAAGTIYDINLPAVNGIYASFASTGGVTFGYA